MLWRGGILVFGSLIEKNSVKLVGGGVHLSGKEERRFKRKKLALTRARALRRNVASHHKVQNYDGDQVKLL